MSAHDLFITVSNTLSVLVEVLSTAIVMYIDMSIVLFIIDAIRAKKQNRKIKKGFKIMFIIAMVLTTIIFALGIYVLVVFLNLLVNSPF